MLDTVHFLLYFYQQEHFSQPNKFQKDITSDGIFWTLLL